MAKSAVLLGANVEAAVNSAMNHYTIDQALSLLPKKVPIKTGMRFGRCGRIFQIQSRSGMD